MSDEKLIGEKDRLIVPVLFKAVITIEKNGNGIDLECDDANELLLAALMRTRVVFFKIAEAEVKAEKKSMSKTTWHKHRHAIELLDQNIAILANHHIKLWEEQQKEDKKLKIEIVKS